MSRWRAAVAAALAGYAALLAIAAPAWPDDWDGVGFVASVTDFDPAAFRPHPPGYPVYVALLRLARAVARDPMRACVLVAVASGVTTVVLVGMAVRERAGRGAAVACAALVGLSPLAWRACSGVSSEGPALACAAACLWAIVPAGRGRSLALGVAAGLGLGVRLSWAPIYLAALAVAPPSGRRVAWAGCAAACLAWAVPLVAIVGPGRLPSLVAAHFAGHASRWGGTAVTDPGVVRAGWLARDVLVDGLGVGVDPVGVAIGAVVVAAAAGGLRAWRRAGWRGWRLALALAGPYLIWIAFGQNLRDQPRHALPIAAALAGALGVAATRAPRGLALAVALGVTIAAQTAMDAHDRRAIPPPGEQLVQLARAQPVPDRLAVFGVSSVRFFEATDLASRAYAAGSLGDVEARLAHLDRLPGRLWVTSEVEGRDASPWPLVRVATLCRPPRIDRRAPCLDVFDWRLPYLP